MALIICIILIALVAFAMYDHISPDLPKEWQMDKSGAAHSSANGAKGASGADGTDKDSGAVDPMTSASSRRWLVMSDGTNSRLVRNLSTQIRGGNRVFDAPTLYLQCSQGNLYVWLDTRLRAAPSSQDPGRVSVQVNSLPAELWVSQEAQNLATPNPHEIMSLVAQQRPIHFTLAFGEASAQTLTLNTDGYETVEAALAPCKQ